MMTFSGLEYAWPYFLSTFVSLGMISYAWTRRKIRMSWYFKALMIFAAGWAFSSGMHLLLSDIESKLLWVDLKYVFVAGMPVAWVLMAVGYAGWIDRITGKRALLLYIIPIFTVLLVGTNGLHGLVFTKSVIVRSDILVTIAREYGPWFWIHTVYSYGLVAAGLVIFLRQVVLTTGFYRRQAFIMLAGALIPFIFNAVYLSNPGLFNHLDSTPIAFSVSGVIFAIGLFRYGLLDIVPIARAEAVRLMDDPMIVLDRFRRVLDANDAAVHLLGLDSGGNVGERLYTVAPCLSDIDHALAGSERYRCDLLIEAPDGSSDWFDCRSKDLRSQNGDLRGWLLVFREVTDMKNAAFQLQRAKERAEELSTLKSTFLSTMSHEIRTPLAGIIGLADVLTSETTGEHQEFAQMIMDGGNRLLRTLNSVLSVSMLSSGRVAFNHSCQDVRAVCRKSISGFREMAEKKGLAVDSTMPLQAVMADIDESHLEHALSHVIENAVKFTDSGRITIKLATSDDMVAIAVSDTGMGIDAQYLPKLFDAFTQASTAMERELDGSGLGLCVARGLLEEMGGTITVDTIQGEGSVFTLHFPLSQKQENDRPAMARRSERPTADRKADRKSV